ncbi:MAG: hypothetical protein AAF226_11280, partial [Verrucomicrobiota bacterium]
MMKLGFLRCLLCLLVAASFWGRSLADDSALQLVLKKSPEQPQKMSSSKNVVIAWSKNDHPPHTHGYQVFAETYGALLSKIEGMDVSLVEGFPSAEAWQAADLVIFYLTIKELDDSQYALLDAHIAQGKSLMVLHQGIVQRGRSDDWADRIGYSFSWEKETRSKWGRFSAPVVFDLSH